jgi:hypothetical protein
MYRISIAVPADVIDDVMQRLRPLSQARIVKRQPAQDVFGDDPNWYHEPGDEIAFVDVRMESTDLAEPIKEWLGQQSHRPMLDVRGQTASGDYTFSFRHHNESDIRNWIDMMSVSQEGSNRANTD